jgi:hypothetical protein
VRWGTLELAHNDFQHAVEILDYVAVPEPNDPIAPLGQFGAPPFIGVPLFAMLTAIELDHKLSRGAGEVGDALADRMLAAKSPVRQVFPGRKPEDSLDIGGVAAKLARHDGSRSERFHRASPPHPALSAPGGGEGNVG